MNISRKASFENPLSESRGFSSQLRVGLWVFGIVARHECSISIGAKRRRSPSVYGQFYHLERPVQAGISTSPRQPTQNTRAAQIAIIPSLVNMPALAWVEPGLAGKCTWCIKFRDIICALSRRDIALHLYRDTQGPNVFVTYRRTGIYSPQIMASSLWTKVARAGAAGLRPRGLILLPSLRHSFLRSGKSRFLFFLLFKH
jgi:hypothetical protein